MRPKSTSIRLPDIDRIRHHEHEEPVFLYQMQQAVEQRARRIVQMFHHVVEHDQVKRSGPQGNSSAAGDPEVDSPSAANFSMASRFPGILCQSSARSS